MRRGVVGFALFLLVALAGTRPAVAQSAVAAPPTLATAADRSFTRDGVTIRYRDFGRGDPVILIHGFTRSLEDWVGLADSLALSHRIVVLDVRGHGKSTTFREPERFGRHLADDVVRLLDHLGIRQTHLVGHSMGALIAANLGVRHPDRVRGVALVAGPFYPDSVTFARETGRWVADLEAGRGLVPFIQWLFPGTPEPAAAQFSAGALASNDVAVLIAVMRSMGALAVGGGVARPIPALITVGRSDPLWPLSEGLAGRWTGARLLILDGADHVTIAARPEVLAGIRGLVGVR